VQVRGLRTSGDAQARIQGNMLLALNTLMPRLDRVYASRSAAAPDGFEERIGVVGRPLIGYRKYPPGYRLCRLRPHGRRSSLPAASPSAFGHDAFDVRLRADQCSGLGLAAAAIALLALVFTFCSRCRERSLFPSIRPVSPGEACT